jgi:hypothetical protein
VETGGSLPKTIDSILADLKPEAAYFAEDNDSCQLQHLFLAAFNLHKARVRRASGFLLTAFSNARPNPLLHCSPRARLRKSTSVTRERSISRAVIAGADVT